MHKVLSKIIDSTRNEVTLRKSSKRRINFGKKIEIIAEIKLASPSAGILGSKKTAIKKAGEYQKAGAAMISVITEGSFFKGDLNLLSEVKEKVRIPVFQKDFILDPYQIYEAKIYGADYLLLIARILSENQLLEFVDLCQEIGIEPVVEINNEEDLLKALKTSTRIIAVNSRDLDTFEIDVDCACRLIKKIPDNFIKFAFSGVKSSEEFFKYRLAGVRAILIGTSLMKTKNVREYMADLRKVKVKICGVRSLKAANTAIGAGADFLGFNFVPTSKRYIKPKEAKKIINRIKNKIKIVGIFQNEDPITVEKISKDLDLDYIQLHGDENKKYSLKMTKPVIKAFTEANFTDGFAPDFIMIDKAKNGKSHLSFSFAKKIAQNYPIFLAGGLTPENVSEAIIKVNPLVVDVASGIETNNVEDLVKIRRFIKNAKGVNL